MPANRLTDSPTSASASACASRITSTSSRKSPSSTGSRSSPKITCVDARPPAGGARSNPRAISGRAARRLHVLRLDRPPESRASQTPQDPREAHQDAVPFRSSLLGQRRRHLHARSAADALYLRRRQEHRRDDSRGAAIFWKFRSAWKTSAAMPNFTFRK